LNTLSWENTWRVFPNPASDYLMIRFNPNHSGVVNIKLTNAQGAIHFSHSNWNHGLQKEMKIPVSSMKAGIYYLHVQSKEGLGVQKVIIH
jgi:hypothetical protein